MIQDETKTKNKEKQFGPIETTVNHYHHNNHHHNNHYNQKLQNSPIDNVNVNNNLQQFFLMTASLLLDQMAMKYKDEKKQEL